MAKAEITATLKFRKLCLRFPDMAPAYLLGHLDMMWLTAWQSHSVSFANIEDAEVAAGWRGDPEAWGRVMLADHWLDQTDLGLEIHDWWVHAPEYVRRRKENLLIALARGYEVREKWLADRGISPTADSQQPPDDGRRPAGSQPVAGCRPPRPNPSQPKPTQPKRRDVGASPAAPAPPTGKRARFTPPTPQEVQGYLDEIHEERFTGVEFVAAYESQGWKKANGQKVVSWKSCVTTWQTVRNEKERDHRTGAGRGRPPVGKGRTPRWHPDDVPWQKHERHPRFEAFWEWCCQQPGDEQWPRFADWLKEHGEEASDVSNP